MFGMTKNSANKIIQSMKKEQNTFIKNERLPEETISFK